MQGTDAAIQAEPLKLGVFGLWHLGCVTAAACASLGHQVLGLDDDAATLVRLRQGKAPISEPGLDDLLAQGIAASRLKFSTTAESFAALEVLWVCFDTPVDEEDRADVDFVVNAVAALLPKLPEGCVVLLSSQLPVGSARSLEKLAAERVPHLGLEFAVSPENLRLGGALQVFLKPDRVVMGCRAPRAKAVLERLLAPLNAKVEWMSPESAEMSKHAINSFLALSVTFANELATLCEKAGADAKDVERSLKSEARIGPKAYLGPGGAFAGGTLARDIAYLTALGEEQGFDPQLIRTVRASNDAHKSWVQRKLVSLLGPLQGKRIGVWGLTYKADTDTLRRSTAVELVDWLLTQGASVKAHDPAVPEFPERWAHTVQRVGTALEAAQNCHALVLCAAWKDYLSAETAAALPAGLIVVDVNRSLKELIRTRADVRHHAVGTPQ